MNNVEENIIIDDNHLPEDDIAIQQPELITQVGGGNAFEGDVGGPTEDTLEADESLINLNQPQAVLNSESEGITSVSGVNDIEIRSDNNSGNSNNSDNNVEMVPREIVDEIARDVLAYSQVDGYQSSISRSEREKQKKEIYDMLTISVEKFVGLGLQMELHEARKKYGVRAVKAAADEIKQLLRKKVFRGVTLEEEEQYNTRPIPSSMKIKEKFKGGLLSALKGRLTGGGHKMNKMLFEDIKYAPTVSTTTVMTVAAIAGHENRAVATLDFTGAFLYADMPNDRQRATLVRLGQFLTRILVKLDSNYEKYVRFDGTCVVVLDKALYGTIIAAAAWYNKISGDMKKFGYSVSKYDNCLFYRNILNKNILVVLHVDDMKFAALGGESAIDIAINEIQNVYDETTVSRGKTFHYLGMDFDYSKPGQVTIGMDDYVNNALKIYEDKYGELSTSKIPANDDIFKKGDILLNSEYARDYVGHTTRRKHQRYQY
jgi:hypothetical protein